MASFPSQKLTLDEIAEINRLGSRDSLGLDDLIFDVLPSGEALVRKDGQPGSQSLIKSGPVVESLGASAQQGLPSENLSGFHLPIQKDAPVAEFHSIPNETLTLNQFEAWTQSMQIGAPSLNATILPLNQPKNTPGDLGISGRRVVSTETSDEYSCDPSSHEATPQLADPKRRRTSVRSTSTTTTTATTTITESKKEAQRLYRAKNRAKAQQAKLELEASLAAAQEEMKALKLEQEKLCSESTVLQGMIDYKNCMIASARNALGNFSAAGSILYSVFGQLQTAIWNKLIHASDDQIDAFSKDDAVLASFNKIFFNLLTSNVLEWGSANPEKRGHIEKKLGMVLAVRDRAVQKIWRYDQLRVARGMHNPPVDQESLSNLASAVSVLPEEELASALALTDDQKEALNEYWTAYIEKYNTSRSVLTESVSSLEISLDSTEKNAAANGEVAGNMQHAAKGFISVAEAVAELDGFTAQELIARAELILGAWSVLRPLQHTVILFDVTPKIDIVGIYKNLLELGDDTLINNNGKQHLLAQYKQSHLTLCNG